MPVRTGIHSIWVHHHLENNSDEVKKFLARIIADLDVDNIERDTELAKKKLLLLAKTVLKSFSVTSGTVDYETMREYYHEDGSPISLEKCDIVLEDYDKYDGIECLIIVYDGPDEVRKRILFERHCGFRRISVMDA